MWFLSEGLISVDIIVDGTALNPVEEENGGLQKKPVKTEGDRINNIFIIYS